MTPRSSDYMSMGADGSDGPYPGESLLAIYDQALPCVYGYLLSRSGDRETAEDHTSATFLAALSALEVNPALPVSTAWLVGIARHKLVDHWRAKERSARRQRRLAVEYEPAADPWDVELDALRVRDVLGELGPHHRAALTLRYLDGLPVGEVAGLLGRSRTATETLLMRAKAAFRRSYEARQGAGDA